MCRCLFAILTILCLACASRGNAAPPSGRIALSPPPCSAQEHIPRPSSHSAAPVRAVFIDLDGSYDWRGFLETHAVNEVVVQNIKGISTSNDTFPKYEEAIALLASVPSNVRVYMGLVYEANFYPVRASKEALDSAAAEDVKEAKDLWARLTPQQQNRIAGWYLAREIFNFRAPEGEEYRSTWVKEYLAAATTGLPGPQNVLISPYFVPPVPARTDLLGARETADLFAYLIEGSRVNGVLLQDGTGARNYANRELKCKWSLEDYLPVAAHYANTVARRLPQGVTFWSNVEAFGTDATRDRLNQQLSLTPRGAPVIVFAYRQCCTTGVCRRRQVSGSQ